MRMGADIRTKLAQRLEDSRNDRKGFTANVDSSDDDDVEPGEVSDPAFKSFSTPQLGQGYVVDSDDDSLFSETGSLDTDLLTTGSTIPTVIQTEQDCTSSDDDVDSRKSSQEQSAASAFCKIENPMYDVSVELSGKQMVNSVAQQRVVPANELDERSRLMAAPQAASIPSNDSFSDDSDADERSRLMAAAQAAAIPSNDSFSDDSDVDERSKLMAAAQAAAIPSENDSFSDDTEDGSPHVGLIPKIMPKITREISPSVVPKAHRGSEDLEWDEGSSFRSVGSDIEGYSTDGVPMHVDSNAQKKTTIDSHAGGYSFRKPSRNSAECEAGDWEDLNDGSDGWERSDYAKGNDGRKAHNWDVNSASFSATSTSFKWANVKTKIFYSFRALKASASSNSDGSRTISVRNLAKEVTDDRLRDFFQDSGTILEILIVRDTQSGLNSAYVEFDSASAARKAVQKSGKKLEGRVIMCDTAYENSRGARSSGSGHGTQAARSKLFESDSSSTESRLAENYAALKMFNPELQVGDEKFLSRFKEPVNCAQSFTRHTESAGSGSRLIGERHPAGSSKGKGILAWPDSYEDAILKSGKTQAELGESVYYDAMNLESQRSFSNPGRRIPASTWRRRKVKLATFLWSWKWSRWQWWQLAKQSSTWARRKSCRDVDTVEEKVLKSVKERH